ncbi:MAG: peptide deformylase [Myxococcales bacterium]|nr:peptide deformylase [Myxococcales bacterium]
MHRSIVIWPEKVLTTPARDVTDFGPGLQSLLGELEEAVRAAQGIGIAANQLGEPLRVALVGREDGSFFEVVNPEVLALEEPLTLNEGCLSVPEQYEDTPRFKRVRVRYQDRHGELHQLDAEGQLAHVLQHEIDHLRGVVFVSKLSSLKRELIKSRMLKLKRPATRTSSSSP